MWNELESYRNNFLKWRFPNFKSETLNAMVQKEFESVQTSKESCILPCKEKPPSSTYFDERAKMAYGFWALPQLLKDACSDVPLTQWRAINSLSELLMNPLEAQRAINEEDIVRKLRNIFLRKRRNYNMEKFREVERLIHIFYILSIYLNGAQQIALKRNLLVEYYIMIYNREKYAEVASKILRNLSEKTKVLLHLLKHTEAMNHITTIFFKDPCTPYYPHALWMHLSNFLEVAPEQAIERGFFELFHRRIVGKVPQYHRMNMKCFALLLQCKTGQRKFDEFHGIKIIYRILTEDEPLDTYEFVVLAFQNALIGKCTLWRCREHMDIANILVQLARQRLTDCTAKQDSSNGDNGNTNEDGYGKGNANGNVIGIGDGDGDHEFGCYRGRMLVASANHATNTRLQLYCLQSIRQMGQMPVIKRYIHEVCLEDIRKIECLNELNECVRDDLVKWLNTTVYHSK